MVMDRCHPEKSFAAGPAEPGDLDDHRDHFDHVDKTDDRDKEGESEHVGDAGDKTAQGQGSGVSHKNLRRIGIVDQKAQQSPDHGRTGNNDTGGGGSGRDDKKDDRRDRHAGGQAVHAVRKVGPVDRAHRDEDHHDRVKDPEIQDRARQEGNLQRYPGRGETR